jgi:hypothetical protein
MKTLKYLIPAFVFFMAQTHSLAQKYTVQAGEKSLIQNSITKHKIFGHDSLNYYVVEFSGTQYYLVKLDPLLNPVQKESIKLFKGLKSFELEYIVDFYDQIYLFVSLTQFNSISLYYQKIDKKTLKPSSEPLKITTIDNIKGSWADFHFALSREETRLMIAGRTKIGLSGAQFNEYYVFGKDLNLIWKKNDSYEFKGQGPRDNVYLVDEEGNISIISLLKRESLMSLFRQNKNMYSIYRYTSDGNEFHEYPITLGSRYIRGIKIAAINKNELVCTGFFSETFKTGIKGTFLMRINQTGQMGKPFLNDFEEGALDELSGLNEPMIKGDELVSYVMSDIVFRNNGKILLIAEQIFYQTYNTYNNIIVTCYNVNGGVDWTRIIPKKQNFNYKVFEYTGVNLVDYRNFIRETGFFNPITENCCSYALMAPVDKSGIVLFYNDHIANLDAPNSLKAFSQPKKSYLLAVSIDEYGSITKTPLIPWKKKMLYPEPMRYYDTLGNTLVIPAFKNRSVNFYKLEAEAIP